MRGLIIGIDGQIGKALAQSLRGRGWDVVGTSRRPASGQLFLDLSAPPPDMALPDVDVAFLCAAMTSQAACRANLQLAEAINVRAPALLAERLSERGTRVIYLSSSAVFDGQIERRPAGDQPCPINTYGRHKAAAEQAVLAQSNAAVLRLTKTITPGLPLFAGWLAALRAGNPVRAFSDLVMAPVTIEDVCEALWAIAGARGDRIFQISALHDISYVQAARHMAQRIGAREDLVISASARDHGIPACDIPCATSLDAGRLSELLGRPMRSPTDALDLAYELGMAPPERKETP